MIFYIKLNMGSVGGRVQTRPFSSWSMVGRKVPVRGISSASIHFGISEKLLTVSPVTYLDLNGHIWRCP
jgi:hypothetical protein